MEEASAVRTQLSRESLSANTPSNSFSLSLHIFVLLLEEFILLTTSLCWVSRLFVGIEEEGRSSGRRLIKAKNEMEQTVDRLGGSD
jgi:hypothetical protein